MRDVTLRVLLLVPLGGVTACVYGAHPKATAFPARTEPRPEPRVVDPNFVERLDSARKKRVARALQVDRNDQLVLPEPIQFETGSAKLREASLPVLERVCDYLFANPGVTSLRIEGHTDDSVDASWSEERALSVARWLAENGVDCKRLIPVGFGSTKPIDSSTTLIGNAANWRIAFVIAALQGHAIRGMPLDGGGVVAGDPCK